MIGADGKPHRPQAREGNAFQRKFDAREIKPGAQVWYTPNDGERERTGVVGRHGRIQDADGDDLSGQEDLESFVFMNTDDRQEHHVGLPRAGAPHAAGQDQVSSTPCEC